jgi:hypothetical protein
MPIREAASKRLESLMGRRGGGCEAVKLKSLAKLRQTGMREECVGGGE